MPPSGPRASTGSRRARGERFRRPPPDRPGSAFLLDESEGLGSKLAQVVGDEVGRLASWHPKVFGRSGRRLPRAGLPLDV